MTSPYPYNFEAVIEKFGVGKTRKIWYTVLFLPQDIAKQLPFKQYPRLRVEGEIADVPVANAFIPAGDGRYYVILAPKVLKDSDAVLGDRVEMRFKIADQNHVDVPDALQVAINRSKLHKTAWAALTPGKRRMLAQHVISAKTQKTRYKRIDEALQALVKHGGDLKAWRAARD